MQNPVNERLGKRRNNYTERASRKLILKKANQLAKECGWRSELAKSVLALEEETGVES